ncbi:MAG: SGNH/GDSL hydrolase family protein [Muribaculaceae bacterium]|nr:SGNH/GDSL hydrolase family protein [Muribaculaceae bacterium]
MKKYLGLWSVLAISFALFFCSSALGDIDVDFSLRSSGMFKALTGHDRSDQSDALFSDGENDGTADAASNSEQPSDAYGESPAESPEEAPAEPPVNVQRPTSPDGKVILFIGDSMLEGLSPRLAAYAKENGHSLYSVIWYSSTSEIWGETTKVKEFINKYKPDFLFICLGANELFVRDIENKRDKYVKNMVSQIGSLPYLWIGPPNWKPDTGINRLIEKNTRQGCYFKSDGMHFDRAKDGAHPTRASAVLWMDSIVRWMPAHSPYKLKLNKPSVNTAKANRVEVIQPGHWSDVVKKQRQKQEQKSGNQPKSAR